MQQQTTYTNTGSGRISRRAKKQETFLDSQDIYKMSFYYGRHFSYSNIILLELYD